MRRFPEQHAQGMARFLDFQTWIFNQPSKHVATMVITGAARVSQNHSHRVARITPERHATQGSPFGGAGATGVGPVGSPADCKSMLRCEVS